MATNAATNAATNTATKCQAGSDKHVYAVNHFHTSRAGSDYLVCTRGHQKSGSPHVQ